MTDFLHRQMPKLFPALDLDEGTGDSWDLDDADCAAEGTALDALADDALAEHRRGETQRMTDAQVVKHLLGKVVGLIVRARRLEAQNRDVWKAFNAVNNHLQKYEFRIAELERALKRQAAEQATALAQESREIAAALELAS